MYINNDETKKCEQKNQNVFFLQNDSLQKSHAAIIFKKVSPEPVCILSGTPVIFQHGWNRADTHDLLF